jgi:hypothetical protein
MSTNNCGTCTACCRIFDIPAISKPAGTWCQHCDIGKGCKIYDSRPEMCREFKCLWLLSQEREDPREKLAPELRPDRCKVVFSPSTNERIFAATTMPGSPTAWRRPVVLDLIKTLTSGRDYLAVVVGAPRSTQRTLIDRRGMHEVRMTEPDEHGMQYNIQEEQHDET